MTKKYQVFSARNFRNILQMQEKLTKKELEAIDVVSSVLPFKLNNYVVDELIDWDNVHEDPIFQLTVPQKAMLSNAHFLEMEAAIKRKFSKDELKTVANSVRMQLNPHPASQADNVPSIDGHKLSGIQHKYRETLLFFPSNSQTCHAYCTFCFRWPQFVGIDELKFAMKETDLLVKYLQAHPEVNDVLFTGGDPMVMSAKNFEVYIDALIKADLPNLQTIRIGTKSLSYWPYRFTSDQDADAMLRLFEKIVNSGLHLSIMAHFNHSRELETDVVREAISRIRSTGAQIRSQSPVMKHINDDPEVWKDMWNQQVKLGVVPYYMFIARDTGAQNYFAVDLERCWNIFRKAYRNVSGVARTVRGPSMSADPGKVHVLGVSEINDEKVFVLRFLQARNPKWVDRPFFAKYDKDAVWLDDLEPAFYESEFFFEREKKYVETDFSSLDII